MVREQAKRERRVVMLSDIYKRMFGDDNYIEEFFSKREAEMTDLSERTGGRCFFPTDYDQIKDIYAEVAHELKSTYYLTYVSNQNLPPNSYLAAAGWIALLWGNDLNQFYLTAAGL